MAQIPVIDFDAFGLHRDGKDETKLQKLVSDIDDAFKSHGIAYIVNHGMPKQQIDLAFRHFKEFTLLPAETKEKYAREENKIHGYLGRETENFNVKERPLPDFKECYNYYPWMNKDLIFDGEIPGAGDTMLTLYNEMARLFTRVLEIVARAVEVDFDTFRGLHGGLAGHSPTHENNSTLRYAFYPALEEGAKPEDKQVRFGEHTDYGTLSFVVTNNISGFEFQNRSGEWLPVNPIPDALIVLCANCMERFTTDRYRAVPHRGVFVDGQDRYKDRQAMVFFGCPDDVAAVGSLDGNPRYEKKSYLGYLEQLFHEKFQ
ncbi:probable iron/ascorbate oxidoreductase DDB_G0283291 [Ptychodera flava]|uniref:probable iron/ascorbate oxidoreductase DDB_G0283291 n=1 Tax=Ptychodera flava TaxID=63121 RepID=UPI00396AA4FB